MRISSSLLFPSLLPIGSTAAKLLLQTELSFMIPTDPNRRKYFLVAFSEMSESADFLIIGMGRTRNKGNGEGKKKKRKKKKNEKARRQKSIEIGCKIII